MEFHVSDENRDSHNDASRAEKKAEIKETNGGILCVNSLCMSRRKRKTAIGFQENITAVLLFLPKNTSLFSNQEGKQHWVQPNISSPNTSE